MTRPVSSAEAPSLVRVTVLSSTRRVDLAMPGSVPVAELVPELARRVGLLDPLTVHGGCRLLAVDGQELDGETGLRAQGVRDGAVLTVCSVVHRGPPRVYDDVVEAMADAVERDFRGWPPGWSRRAALVAAVLLTTLGAAALLSAPVSGVGTTAAVAMATALTLLVVCGGVWPWLALGVTGAHVDMLLSPADISTASSRIDPARVRADARLAARVLAAISATVGLLLVLIAPLAVSLGLSGTALAAGCCLVVMLRTRRCRSGQQVLVGLASGVLGLASVGVSVLLTHPEWRTTTAGTLLTTGGLLLVATRVGPRSSLRRERLADLAEACVVLALLPLLVLASGLFSAVRS